MMTPKKRILFVVFITLFTGGSLMAAAGNGSTAMEITYLLDYLKQSDCRFFRNGSWHTAEEAGNHIGRKYSYLRKRSLVITTEDFIERAASRSSRSGEAYRVQCGTSAPVDSAQWFTSELRRYRQAQNQ